MSRTVDASELLRPGLLDGVSVLIAGAPVRGLGDAADAPGAADADGADAAGAQRSLADEVGSACASLGAGVYPYSAHAGVDPGVDLLVIDVGGLFAAGHESAREALRACLDGAWEATHAVANAAFIQPERPGRIVYLAPATAQQLQGAEHADAARAGLENLARTLSIEWARYAITTATVAPGAHTAASEVATLVAYLGSRAGAYFSGCVFDLRGPGLSGRQPARSDARR